MKKRMFVLNTEVSGMNKFLFKELRRHGWQLQIYDVPFPTVLKWVAKLISFSLSISRWKKSYDYHLNKLYKSSWCFRWRTKNCEKILKKEKGNFDIVLNMTGMSAPFIDNNMSECIKYVIITSYTMALSQKYVPWCTYSHEYDNWKLLEQKLYEKSNLIFTTNENARKSLNTDYGIPLFKCINMGYGLTFDSVPEFEKSYDSKIILFVGFDFERKGGVILLKAFDMLRKEIPAAKLIIIGPNKAIHKIKQEGVEFLGPVNDRNKVKEHFKKAALFVMPSICEPFGLVFLEAMAYKLPCIGSNVDAMPEIIEDGKTGFLVNPTDYVELNKRMKQLLENPILLKQMGDAANLSLKNKFSWENVGEIVNHHLEEGLKCNE
jgi:glycosyltransferase involved in cell wall biosynthesis